MFGGSAANAYMLVYRQRKAIKEGGTVAPELPDYWVKEIQEINKRDAIYRDEYEDKKNQFEMVI